MAMVFSVQQGAHGPLVVYKLKVPEASGGVARNPEPSEPVPLTLPLLGTAAPAQPRRAPTPTVGSAPAAYRPGPLQPTVLGTVVMPAATLRPAAPLYPAPEPTQDFEIVAPDYQPNFRVASDLLIGEAMRNAETGEYLTLEEVNDAVLWRRETVEKLRQVPIAPRF
jgi:hypothetical protein